MPFFLDIFHHNKIDEVQGVKTIMAGSFLAWVITVYRKELLEGRSKWFVSAMKTVLDVPTVFHFNNQNGLLYLG